MTHPPESRPRVRTAVQRIIFLAHPTADNREHFEWQTAHLVIFVADDNYESALKTARRTAAGERWNVIQILHCDTLIEAKLRAEGGEVWVAYRSAIANGVFFLVLLQQRGIGDKARPLHVLVPRITEAFIDSVVERAGGHRLTADETNRSQTKNADYLLDDCVLELKILENEGLAVRTRQERLARLFGNPAHQFETTSLDPTHLSAADRRLYYDIVGRPIQDHIKTASKQIASTKKHLGREELQGGVICVNSGYGTLPQEVFSSLVRRYALKDTSQVRVIACISSYFVTNGFDSYVQFPFDPEEPSEEPLQRLRAAFMERVDEMMTEFMRKGMPQSDTMMSPLKPIAFEYEGFQFAWVPSLPPDSRFDDQ